MKQLELNVKIEQVDDPEYPYVISVHAEGMPDSPSWHRGKTLEDAIELFYKSFGEKNLRYWFKLNDE